MAAVEKLVTDHLDLWTAAIKRRSTAGRGSSRKIELYGIKKLRELILELAVRGLLVTQDPKDEPASELLKKIAAEKARLVKDGKAKQEKPLPAIEEGELPFVLPPKWCWARLGDITNYGYCDKVEPEDVNEDTWVLELEDVEKETSRLLRKARFFERDFKSSKNKFKVGDVIYGKLRPYLDKVLVADEDGVCTTEMIPARAYSVVSPEFLRLSMKSPQFVAYANNATHGMNLPRVGTDKARLALIPICSPTTQERIVTKVDDLMALCDQLEQQTDTSLSAHQTLVETLLNALTSVADHARFASAWQRIAEHFDILFTTEESIDQLKQAILQLAVMGKLVPQEPNDEPARELLKRIAAEKAKLVKEGKIKKGKSQTPIEEKEMPFVLPEGWEWSRWDAITFKIGDIDHKMPNEKVDGIPYVSPRDFYENNVIDFARAKKISRLDFERLASKIQPTRGDIIFPRYGTIGENVLVETDIDFLASYSCCVIKTLKPYVSYKYQFIYSISALVKEQCKKAENKTTQPNVGIKSIQDFLFPVPPLAEQHRIDIKVDALMALCNQLKCRLNDAQTTQLSLAAALTEKALARAG